MSEPITRRDFLRKGSILGLGLITPSIRGKSLEFQQTSFEVSRVGEFSKQLGGGRDLGIPCIEESQTIFLFGDTTSENITSGGPKTMADYRPNTGAILVGGDFSKGAVKLEKLKNDKRLWSPDSDGNASTPTGAVVIDGVIYASYMDVVSNAGHDFVVSSSGIVVSKDNGKTWQKHRMINGETSFSQATPYFNEKDGYVYYLSTEGGRLKPAYLSRVLPNHILNKNSYEYWNGSAWGESPGESQPVINDTVGELSISYNTYLKKYLVMYMSPSFGENGSLVFRTAEELNGSWSNASVVKEWGDSPAVSEWYGTYAPQQLTHETGQEIPFLYSHFDDYSVNLGKLSFK